jgi:hypothetical protein
MNKLEEFADDDERLSFLASKLIKLQKIYQQEETRLIKESLDPNSIPSYYKYLEIQAIRFEFDELIKHISAFLKNSKSLDATKRKQKPNSKIFKTSVSNCFNLKGLHKEKVTRQAAHLLWFQLLRLKLNKLLMIIFLVPIFLGIGVGVKSTHDSMIKFSSSQDTKPLISTNMTEYVYGGLQGLGKGVLADFLILYVLLVLPETIFLNFKIRIKEAHQLKLPEVKYTWLKLQALNLAPYVEFNFSGDWVDIALWCRYTREFDELLREN